MANQGITWNHSNDVIFTKNSLENFIHLIQAHGDLSKIKFFSMRDVVKDTNDKEFKQNEKDNHKRDIAIVRYDLPINTATSSNNGIQTLGRHQFLQVGSDVSIAPGNNLGTISITVDDATANAYVKGFSSSPSYDDLAGVKFSGHFLPATANTYYLGSSVYPWKTTYTRTLIAGAISTTGATTLKGNVTIGTSANQKTFTINGRTINFTHLPTATGTVTQFLRGDGNWSNSLPNSLWSSNADAAEDLCNGVIGNSGRIYFYSHGSTCALRNNTGIYGFNKSGTGISVLYITPNSNTVYFSNPCQFNSNITSNGSITDNGSMTIKGNTTIGTAATPVTVKINGRTLQVNRIPSDASDSAHFWRGDGIWSNVLSGSLTVNSSNATGKGLILSDDGDIVDNNDGYCTMRFVNGVRVTAGKDSNTSKICLGSSGDISAVRVFNAVFNDYAECRKTINLEPGRVVVDNDDGSLSCSSQRLQPGAQVISDTYGNLMGETDDYKTPLAVAGRVLTYTYQPRENYHAGMAVCSAPNGTIDIMTREEIAQYPDCIMGIVSEIPNYDIWGTNEVKVDGRIWIKVH